MSTCPSSTDAGCRCVEHAEGLMAYAPHQDAYARALAKLRPVLRVVTMPADLEEPCAGTYGCACRRCTKQRAVLMHQGSRDVRQPWQPRRAA